jgi:hypothetical protein
MPTPKPEDDVRYCIINPQGGQITVQLQANNALRAPSKFALYPPADFDNPREIWDMKPGDLGSSTYPIKAASDTLQGNALAWRIDCCSMEPSIDHGMVSISILQGGAPCPLTKPTQWVLTNVPNCEANENNVIEKTGFLQFVFKS